MFRPLQMKNIKVFVLDEYLDNVMSSLGKNASVQIAKVKEEFMEPLERKKILERYNELLKKINHLMDVLGIEDREIERVPMPSKSSEEYLADMEEEIAKINKETLPITDKIAALGEEKKSLKFYEAAMEVLKNLEVQTKWLGKSDYLHVISGFIDPANIEELDERLEKAVGEEYLLLEEENPPEDAMLAVIATHRENKGDVDTALRGLKFELLDLENRELKEVTDRLEEISEEETKLEGKFKKIKEKYFDDILVLHEISHIEGKNQEAIMNFGKTRRVYVLEGWAPAKKIKDVEKMLGEVTENCCVVETSDPEEDDDVPVELNNPKFIKPFETVMEMFGLPSYTEIDPTPLMALTFPLFFGLMFGDVGHGGIFAIAGLALFLKSKGNQSMWKIGMLIFYCGFAAVIFGLLYGSFFGDEAILPHLYEEIGLPGLFAAKVNLGIAQLSLHDLGFGNEIHAGHGEHSEVIWLPWKSPVNQMMEMIGITLLIGAIHMGLGLLMSGLNKAFDDGLATLVGSGARIWFLGGEVVIITNLFPFPIPFFKDITMPMTDIVMVGIAAPAVIILLEELVHAIKHGGIGSLPSVIGNGLFEIFEMFSMFLSNTISYARLLILAVVHAMMMIAIYNIAGMETLSGLVVVGPLIIIFGNILVLGLEGLVVFIHTIRLHFYEWFTKFYISGGLKYAPFMVKRRYTELAD